MEVTKVCTNPACAHKGEPQPLSSFTRRSVAPDGHEYNCKDCALARMNKWRRANPERTKANSKKYWKKCKDAAYQAYGGYICSCCGETDSRFLTIDHIDGGGTQHRKQIGRGGHIFAWLKKNGYPEGFQVLCFNCNCGRRINGGICPHKERTCLNEEPLLMATLWPSDT